MRAIYDLQWRNNYANLKKQILYFNRAGIIDLGILTVLASLIFYRTNWHHFSYPHPPIIDYNSKKKPPN